MDTFSIVLLEPVSKVGDLAAAGTGSLSISHLSPSCQKIGTQGLYKLAGGMDQGKLGVGPILAPPNSPASLGPSVSQDTLWAPSSLLRPVFDLSDLPCDQHAAGHTRTPQVCSRAPLAFLHWPLKHHLMSHPWSDQGLSLTFALWPHPLGVPVLFL